MDPPPPPSSDQLSALLSLLGNPSSSSSSSASSTQQINGWTPHGQSIAPQIPSNPPPTLQQQPNQPTQTITPTIHSNPLSQLLSTITNLPPIPPPPQQQQQQPLPTHQPQQSTLTSLLNYIHTNPSLSQSLSSLKSRQRNLQTTLLQTRSKLLDSHAQERHVGSILNDQTEQLRIESKLEKELIEFDNDMYDKLLNEEDKVLEELVYGLKLPGFEYTRDEVARARMMRWLQVVCDDLGI